MLTQPFLFMCLCKRDENICPYKDLYKYVHHSFVYDSKHLKATQISINTWMERHILVHALHGILLGNKKEWTIDMIKQCDESQNKHERKKPDQKSINTVWPIIWNYGKVMWSTRIERVFEDVRRQFPWLNCDDRFPGIHRWRNLVLQA